MLTSVALVLPSFLAALRCEAHPESADEVPGGIS